MKLNITTFRDLLHEFGDGAIVIRLLQLYPDQKDNEEGYFEALSELRKLKPLENIHGMAIHVERDNDEDNQEFYSVYGIKQNDEMTYSFALTPWDNVLGYIVDDETVVTWPRLDIVCHILWEITYYGYGPDDHEKLRRELEDRIERIENGNK